MEWLEFALNDSSVELVLLLDQIAVRQKIRRPAICNTHVYETHTVVGAWVFIASLKTGCMYSFRPGHHERNQAVSLRPLLTVGRVLRDIEAPSDRHSRLDLQTNADAR